MNIKKILTLSRPRFWFYTLGPFLIGIAATDNIRMLLNLEVIYGLLFFLLPANLFIYAVNDYFDRKIDSNNPKKKKQESFMKESDKRLYFLIIATSLFLSVPLIFYSYQIALVLFIFLSVGFFYSSPPIRFKTTPFLDSLSNFFYILPGVMGFYMVTNTFPPLHLVIAGSLWAVAMHLFSAIVDIESDKKEGVSTTATLIGNNNSLLLTGALWFCAWIIALPSSPALYIGILYPLIPMVVFIKRYNTSTVYWLFPWINTIMGFLLFCIVVYGK